MTSTTNGQQEGAERHGGRCGRDVLGGSVASCSDGMTMTRGLAVGSRSRTLMRGTATVSVAWHQYLGASPGAVRWCAEMSYEAATQPRTLLTMPTTFACGEPQRDPSATSLSARISARPVLVLDKEKSAVLCLSGSAPSVA